MYAKQRKMERQSERASERAKEREREGNLFLFVWKRYAPVNGSAAIRMFARNERSTLFSACITICSIRSRQSLKLFDARVIDAPPPHHHRRHQPAPPSRHRRRHRLPPPRCNRPFVRAATSVNSSAPLWLTSSLWILYFMITNAGLSPTCVRVFAGKVIYLTEYKENLVKSSSC